MPRDKTSALPAPRYLRATAISTLAASVIPAALMIYAAYDIQHGPPVEASEAQGSAIILAHLLAAILFVAIAFPFAGWLLCKRQALTRQRFYRTSFLLLTAAALLPAALLASIGFGLSAFLFAPASFAVVAFLALPFRPLWFKLAQ
ncbi:hypothetical protein [Methylotuvimicrobium sp. KM1]|uniref:hypothetical protein n=1 Tax=Methylotuvimicrobium sp. KM1 TaxID=3377707 RepID=UPI0038513822